MTCTEILRDLGWVTVGVCIGVLLGMAIGLFCAAMTDPNRQ